MSRVAGAVGGGIDALTIAIGKKDLQDCFKVLLILKIQILLSFRRLTVWNEPFFSAKMVMCKGIAGTILHI